MRNNLKKSKRGKFGKENIKNILDKEKICQTNKAN